MACSRRKILSALPGALAAPALAAQVSSKTDASKLTMPGPYRGKVVAVEHPRSIVSGAFQNEPVQQMIRTGLTKLTGTSDIREAWRVFVQPGDVVGIKLNPVGKPHVMSSPEVVREIIAGLMAAGIKPQDIVAYDRYRQQFLDAGFDKWLPEKVRWTYAAQDYEEVQQAIEGYDRDHYMDMALVLPGYDLSNLTARRSYAARFITKDVNKLINLAVLKDHQSAGITIALKNLSHGLVNNVNRSHPTPSMNACGSFIPAVVSMPVIRNKAVLHIVDGIKGVYHGGPSAKPQFVWEHKTMYFASDPVAVDRIGWEAIDAQRTAVGKKILVQDLPDQFSRYVHRQTEHVEIAGAMGLGEYDLKKIVVDRVKLS